MFRPAQCLLSALTLCPVYSQAERASRPPETAPSVAVKTAGTALVHWQPWNATTLEQARAGQRPVYVLVASELSEFSRATLRETFSRAATAEWMNQHFVCILADADVQPEVAAYAQHFIQTVRQLRGQPVHLWLTPELEPYDGANYLPPSEEWGMPGFLKAARNALDLWTQNPVRARTLAKEAVAMMQSPPPAGASPPLSQLLDRAASAWVAATDPVHGGFGDAPKLPQPEVLQFLLRRNSAARDAALTAARALVRGAAHDVTNGGFFRRTLDAEWRDPYRQKTLLDQARIALSLFEAYNVAPEPALRDAACRALDFVWRDLPHPQGGFAAALDGTDATAPTTPSPWVKTGRATLAAQAWLLVALMEAQRVQPEAYRAAVVELRTLLRSQIRTTDNRLPHQFDSSIEGTATDYLATAHALRLSDPGNPPAMAEHVVKRALRLYFDAVHGVFLASSSPLPLGIAARVPLGHDGLSAERLALLAGLERPAAAAVRNTLSLLVEYDSQPPGEVLLTLATPP